MGTFSMIDGISILFSIIAASFAVITYYKSIVHDRRQAALEAYNRLQEQAFDHLLQYTPSEMKEIAQNPRSGQYKTVSAYIARIEHFCVGVNQRIYDKTILYELSHGFLDGAIKKRIEPILERKSMQYKEEFYANTKKVLIYMADETERRSAK